MDRSSITWMYHSHTDEVADTNAGLVGPRQRSVPTMSKGQRVRWYTLTLGTEVDLHTPHWHGNTETTNGMGSDMIQLMPGMMMVSDMVPDNPGTWLYHCHVNDHIVAGRQMR